MARYGGLEFADLEPPTFVPLAQAASTPCHDCAFCRAHVQPQPHAPGPGGSGSGWDSGRTSGSPVHALDMLGCLVVWSACMPPKALHIVGFAVTKANTPRPFAFAAATMRSQVSSVFASVCRCVCLVEQPITRASNGK